MTGFENVTHLYPQRQDIQQVGCSPKRRESRYIYEDKFLIIAGFVFIAKV